MAETQTRTNPLIAAAAVAVIIFSAVGVGVMTGVIPSSKSASDSLSAPEAKVAAAPEAKAPPAPPAATKPAPHTTPKRSSDVNSRQRPAQVAMNDTPARTAAAPVCNECGVVDAVNVINRKGESSPLGVAGGAVVGGLVGHQIGSGRGNTAATIVGAVGGAMAGNEVEKRMKSVKEYQVTVRMEAGNSRTFAFANPPGYEVGDRVRVVDGRLTRG